MNKRDFIQTYVPPARVAEYLASAEGFLTQFGEALEPHDKTQIAAHAVAWLGLDAQALQTPHINTTMVLPEARITQVPQYRIDVTEAEAHAFSPEHQRVDPNNPVVSPEHQRIDPNSPVLTPEQQRIAELEAENAALRANGAA